MPCRCKVESAPMVVVIPSPPALYFPPSLANKNIQPHLTTRTEEDVVRVSPTTVRRVEEEEKWEEGETRSQKLRVQRVDDRLIAEEDAGEAAAMPHVQEQRLRQRQTGDRWTGLPPGRLYPATRDAFSICVSLLLFPSV
jgi:hypothetical protein